jgi:hypothetical protein
VNTPEAIMARYRWSWQKAEQLGLDALVLAVGWAFTLTLAHTLALGWAGPTTMGLVSLAVDAAFKFLSAEAVPPAQAQAPAPVGLAAPLTPPGPPPAAPPV